MGLGTIRRWVPSRRLRPLFAAWTAFCIGDYAYFVLAIVITFVDGGALAVGVATVLNVLPGGLLGPLAATLATSRRPELHLAIGHGARALTMVVTIVAVLGGSSVGVVLALVAVDSLAAATVRPLHSALCVRMAENVADGVAANALTGALLRASALAGPMLAAAGLSVLGIGWAFAVPGLAFVTGTVAAMLIRVSPFKHESPTSGSVLAQLSMAVAGFRAILVSRSATAATSLFLINVTLLGVWFVVSASVAKERLGLGEGGITTVTSAFGAGGLLGALVTMSIVGRSGLSDILAGAMVGWAIALAVIGMIAAPAPGLTLAAGVGAADAVVYAIAPTLVQRSVAQAAMVHAAAGLQSLYMALLAAGGAIGAVLIGSVGVSAALGIAAGSAVLTTALAWPYLRGADQLSSEDAAKLAVIRGTPMLAQLPALSAERLARGATLRTVRAGPSADVIRQGDRGDLFFMIAAGLAEVTVDGRSVATLGPGGSFGEIALLQDVLRTATVTAREDLTLVAVDRASFLGVLAGSAEAVSGIGTAVQFRLATAPVEERLVVLERDAALDGRSVAEMLAAQRPLNALDDGAISELSSAARVLAAPSGALITREGDYGDSYYVILDGAVQVLEGSNPVRKLGPGAGFGEQAILGNVPRTATVRAVEDTTLVAVDRESFQRARQAG